MTKPKRYRWKCPTCDAGRLLGRAPRRNATARFCLACSQATGTLVELVCPTLDRQREKSAAKRATKKKRATRRKADPFLANGVDLREDLRRIYDAARKIEPDLPARLPRLTVHRRRAKHWDGNVYTSGRAWWREHRIHITAGTNVAEVFAVLVHEVAHLVARRRGETKPHGDLFKSAEAELAREVGSPSVDEARRRMR